MTKFSDAELQIMKLLWKNGEMKPAEIQRLSEASVKNSAIRFTLSVLLENGHVKRRLIGKAYHYTPIAKRAATFRRSLKEMVDVFFEGSTDALLMSLIKSEQLSEEELIELQHIASKPTGTPQKEPPTKRQGSRKSKGGRDE